MCNFAGKYPGLILIDLHLNFSNFYFEKGDGVYDVRYTPEAGENFQFQFWEQLGSSNKMISYNFLNYLENCK